MTSILFVTQSSTRGGVVTMLGHILSNWPSSDSRKLVLAHNKAHGGKQFFESLASGRIEILEVPIWDHMSALAGLGLSSAWRKLFIKLLNRMVQPLLFMQAVLYFRKLCLELNVAVLFSHNGGYPGGNLNRAAVWGARIAGVRRICLVVHNLAKRPSLWMLPAAWLQDTLLFRAATDVIAVSEACANILSENRFTSKEVRVVYNGIPVLPVLPVTFRPAVPVVAYIGELSERKGIPILFQAIAAIPEPVLLVLYGKGEPKYETRLRELSRELGIASRVKFMGFDADATRKLAEASMLVLPSVAYESFGMVLLEAMQHKKPVIATDVGGMKEVVVDGETGFIVPAANSATLADAIVKLLRDAPLAARLGENGYQRLCEKFSVEKMISNYYSMTI